MSEMVDAKKLAQQHRLYYKICRDCRVRNSPNAKKCRACKSKNLRWKRRVLGLKK